MSNGNQAQVAPNPGTKDALKAELEKANADLAAATEELEKLKAQMANTTGNPDNKAAPQKAAREKIFVPRGPSNDEPNLFISVNGVNYLLPKGKESEVPAHIAAEYRRMQRAMERRDRNKAAMLDASK